MYIYPVLTVAVIAAIYDVRTYKIPNWLTLGAIVFGFLLSFTGYGAPGGIIGSLKGFLLGGLVLMPFFMIGAMGGGDVKLAAAFGAIGGSLLAINMLLVGSLAGGVMALAVLLRTKGARGAIKSVKKEVVHLALMGMDARPDTNTNVIPYGVALSLGAIIALLLNGYGGGYIYGG